MNKSKQTIEESLKKIKFMMNYDSSKTLTEQADLATIGNTAAGLAARPILGWPEYLKGSQPSNNGQPINVQTPFDNPSAVALGDYKAALKEMFDYTKTYRSQLSKVPRGISDAQVAALSKTLYSTMQGLGLNKKPVANVFEMLKSASDFVALNDTFNATYGAKQDLYTWIIKEWGMGTNTQQRILTSLQNLMTAAAKGQPVTTTPENPSPQIPQKVPALSSGGYKPVTGTADDPYRFGTSGEGIKTLQGSLGLVQDGRFGTKTQAALQPLGIQTFTDEDLPKLVAQIRGKNTGASTAPTAQLNKAVPKFGTNPNINMPNMGTTAFNLVKPPVKTA